MPTKPNRVASGCLILFGLPFMAAGLFFAVVSFRSLDDPKFQNPWIGVFVGCGVALLGALIMAAAVSAFKSEKRDQAIQAAYPSQPWMWRKDWAQGRAPGQNAGSAVGAWIFALVWNGMAYLPVYFFFTNAASSAKPPVLVFIAIFPLVGVLVLIWAIRQTMRVMRFGKTFLQLQSVPAPLGGSLRGTIDARLPYPLPHGINLALTCVNRVTTGSGNSRSTFDHIRWQGKQELSSERIMAGPAGSAIPVDFEIPRDMPQTDSSNVSNEILWLLRAEADVPGVNFDETYQVPVFETKESPSLQNWQAHEEVEDRQHPPTAPIRPTVQLSSAPEGGTQLYFPAGRNTSASLGVTLFFFLFGGAEAAILYLHAPLIFPIAFGLFTLLLGIIAVNLWFSTAGIVANSSGVSLFTNTLGLRSSKRWDSSQIKSIHPKINMQSGGGGGGIPYYTATITDNAGREYSIGNAVKDHNEAEWICDQIRQAANLKAKSIGNS